MGRAGVGGIAMGYTLGNKSKLELRGVHPKLVAVVERAIEITEQDFSVHDGLRTEAEQRENVRRGVSQTMKSLHLTQDDGFGHAVDLVPWVNGKLRWEWGPIYNIAVAMRLASAELNVDLIWGGVWDMPFASLEPEPGRMERSVSAYVARRKKLGKRAFIDGPHYQLAQS